MKIIQLTLSIPVDDDVSEDMVRDLLLNQLPLNPVHEVFFGPDGGRVDWSGLRINYRGCGRQFIIDGNRARG